MQKQGHPEPTGQAKITPAYNLPCEYVIHTVGPIVSGSLTKKHEELLASCYKACLAIAEENGTKEDNISSEILSIMKNRTCTYRYAVI